MRPEDPSRPVSNLLYRLENVLVLAIWVKLFSAQGRDFSFVADQVLELV